MIKLSKKLASWSKYRQIIIVTHNANLCFASDATNIIYCYIDEHGNYKIIQDYPESTNQFKIPQLKNKTKILNIALKVLEGGQDAFNKRNAIYTKTGE